MALVQGLVLQRHTLESRGAGKEMEVVVSEGVEFERLVPEHRYQKRN
jgi:hypothetical protein